MFILELKRKLLETIAKLDEEMEQFSVPEFDT